MRTALRAAGLLALVFMLQLGAYAMSQDAGDIALLLSAVAVAVAAWLVGRLFGRRFVMAAAIVGAVIGAAYWFLDWQFLRLVRISILHQFNESNIGWIAGLYALFLWPIMAICVLAAATAAWRRASPPSKN